MMVDRIRQVGELDAARAEMLVSPDLVRKLQDRIGVGDIERVADELHAERRMQMIDEHDACPIRRCRRRAFATT